MSKTNTKKTIVKAAVIIGVLIIPLLYSYFYLGAFWDPYSRLEDVPVAIVNQDSGATINGTKRNLGDEICDNLKEDGTLHFVFTDEETARKGTEGSDYYAMILIPENFSSDIASASSTEKVPATLEYTANEKRNYLAVQILNNAVSRVEKSVCSSVDEEIVVQLSEKLYSVPDSLEELQDGLNQLYNGSVQLNDGTTQLQDGTSTLKSGTVTLKDGTSALLTGTDALQVGSSALLSGTNDLKGGTNSLVSGASELQAGTSDLTAGTSNLQAGADTLKAGTSDLANDASNLKDGAAQFSDKFSQYQTGFASAQTGASDLAQGAQSLNEGIGDLLNGANQLNSATDNLDQLQGAVDSLAAGASDLNNGLMQYTSGVNTLISTVQTETALLAQCAPQLTDPQLQQQVLAYLNTLDSSQLAALSAAGQQLTAASQQISDGLATLQSGTQNLPQLKAGLQQLQQGLTQAKAGAEALSAGAGNLDNGLTQLGGATQQLGQASQQLSQGACALSDGVTQVDGGAAALQAGAAQLNAGAQKLDAGVGVLASGASELDSGASALQSGASQLNSGLNELWLGAWSLDNGASQLKDGAAALDDGALALKDGVSTLKDGTKTAKDGVSDSLTDTNTQLKQLDELDTYAANPISVDQQSIDAVPNYGTAFAPYFLSLSLWVGGLMIFFGIFLDVDQKFPMLGRNSKNKIGRTFIFLLLGLAQALILALIVQFALGLDVKNEALYLVSCFLVSAVFISIIQFCLVVLKDVGKFVAILLLILQLTSCGGTFPMETVPQFFKALYPFMPMTYSVGLFKEAISGSVGATAWHNIWILLGILVLFTVATVLLSGLQHKSKPAQAHTATA